VAELLDGLGVELGDPPLARVAPGVDGDAFRQPLPPVGDHEGDRGAGSAGDGQGDLDQVAELLGRRLVVVAGQVRQDDGRLGGQRQSGDGDEDRRGRHRPPGVGTTSWQPRLNHHFGLAVGSPRP
jgi:hypothetical protein